MATEIEIRANQKNNLFDLLELRKNVLEDGGDVSRINRLIIKAKAPMEQEDVAYVEKMIAELD